MSTSSPSITSREAAQKREADVEELTEHVVDCDMISWEDLLDEPVSSIQQPISIWEEKKRMNLAARTSDTHNSRG